MAEFSRKLRDLLLCWDILRLPCKFESMVSYMKPNRVHTILDRNFSWTLRNAMEIKMLKQKIEIWRLKWTNNIKRFIWPLEGMPYCSKVQFIIAFYFTFTCVRELWGVLLQQHVSTQTFQHVHVAVHHVVHEETVHIHPQSTWSCLEINCQNLSILKLL